MTKYQARNQVACHLAKYLARNNNYSLTDTGKCKTTKGWEMIYKLEDFPDNRWRISND